MDFGCKIKVRIIIAVLALLCLEACNHKKTEPATTDADSVGALAADSAVTDEDVPRYVNALTADMYSERLSVIKRLIEDDSCTDDKSLLIREQSYLKQKLIELKTEV